MKNEWWLTFSTRSLDISSTCILWQQSLLYQHTWKLQWSASVAKFLFRKYEFVYFSKIHPMRANMMYLNYSYWQLFIRQHPSPCKFISPWTKWPPLWQTTFSNTFSWMKMIKFRFKFHWNLFPWVQLTMNQHWFRYWLGAEQATSHYLN